jgi:hypothetical protein
LLAERGNGVHWLAQVDDFLSRMSWDQTFRAMWQLVEAASEQRTMRRPARTPARAALATSAPGSISAIAAPPPG